MNVRAVERDSFFDVLKFFLIAFVVFGHVIEVGEGTRFEIALYNLIYSFHMPLFVFVSGYFSRRYDDKAERTKKLLYLVETYVVFQLFFRVPSIISGNYVSGFNRPWWILWYLFSLIIWRFVLQIIPRHLFENDWRSVLFFSVLLSLLGGFVPIGYDFSFQRLICFWPFFTVGYICANIREVQFREILPNKCVAITYFIVIFIAFYIIDKSFSGVFYGSLPYSSLYGLCGRFVQLIMGCIGSLCFMGLVKGVKLPKCFMKIGVETMFFFIYHAFFVVALKTLKTHFVLEFTTIHIFLCYILIMVLLYLLLHISLLHKLLNPFSSLYDKKNTCRRWSQRHRS